MQTDDDKKALLVRDACDDGPAHLFELTLKVVECKCILLSLVGSVHY